ncbi:MAG: hypothetical protein O3A46_17285, partial [Candidatus Poribacteria bacterium]|nr:hypothetical protein [Candidatus Poribacteria bacterium]
MKSGEPTSNRVTFRAILIGLIYVVFLGLVTPYNDYYIQNTFVSGNHFPIGPFFLFTLLVLGLNPVLYRVRRQSAFRPAELITIWVMMLVASGIPSSGFLRYHLFMLTAPTYFQSPSNDWENLWYHYLPDWLVIKDERAARTFYEGVDGGAIPWGLWVKPALIWSSYVLLTYFVMLCITTLLRKQWVERERFQFPLVKLPAEMIDPPDAGRAFNVFFRNPMMWAGFAVPVFIHMVNGFHAHFPFVPHIPMYFYPDQYLTERPWTGIRSIVVLIYPSVVGFSYLLSLDVSL